MRAHTLSPLRVAFAAMLVAAVPAAHSQMYRWIDAQGSVMYSNQLPSDTRAVKDLTVMLDAPGTVSSPDTRNRATTAIAPSGPRRAAGESLEFANRGAMSETPAAPPPRISIAPTAPEAVRDPCLRSSDPKCYERNRDAYVPHRGYSPSAARASKEMGVGATSSAGAGGTLGGGSPGKIVPPSASVYALPPGSEPIPAVKPGARR